MYGLITFKRHVNLKNLESLNPEDFQRIQLGALIETEEYAELTDRIEELNLDIGALGIGETLIIRYEINNNSISIQGYTHAAELLNNPALIAHNLPKPITVENFYDVTILTIGVENLNYVGHTQTASDNQTNQVLFDPNEPTIPGLFDETTPDNQTNKALFDPNEPSIPGLFDENEKSLGDRSNSPSNKSRLFSPQQQSQDEQVDADKSKTPSSTSSSFSNPSKNK